MKISKFKVKAAYYYGKPIGHKVLDPNGALHMDSAHFRNRKEAAEKCNSLNESLMKSLNLEASK